MAAMKKPVSPPRPKGVPAAAQWIEAEQEWELAPKDARGKKHGKVTWWRRDATIVCECEYAHGVAHGAFTRYHDDGKPSRTGTFVKGKMHGIDTAYRSATPTTELAFPARSFGGRVWRYELDRDMDRVLASRWFDKRGRPVTATGEAMPARPASVPTRATFEPISGEWLDGETDELLARHGVWRTWHKEGALTSEVLYEHGVEKRRVEPKNVEASRSRAPAARRSELFGTDCAGDWLDDLDDEPTLKSVERAIMKAAKVGPRTYLEVDDCEAAVAAAGCIAQLSDKKGANGPLGKDTLSALSAQLAKMPQARRAALTKDAAAAVKLVLEDTKRSELCQRHEEDGARSPWRSQMRRLLARLGPPPASRPARRPA